MRSPLLPLLLPLLLVLLLLLWLLLPLLASVLFHWLYQSLLALKWVQLQQGPNNLPGMGSPPYPPLHAEGGIRATFNSKDGRAILRKRT